MNVAPRSRSVTSAALTRMQSLMQISPRQILAAVLTGVLTLSTAFALAAVSGYLITKAWTMPPVLDLSVAVVSVRALGISRGVFRYLERLFTHDAALTGVARLRTNIYAGLTSAPDALVSRVKKGDLLGRIGDDAEDMANDVIRAVVPVLVALVMAVVVVATIAPFSPVAAIFMVLALAIASGVAPALAYRAALVTERDLVQARSHVTTLTMHAVDNADHLVVSGKFNAAIDDLAQAQAEYDRALDRAAIPSALARACLHIAMIPALLGSVLAAGAVYATPGSGIVAGFMGHTPGIIGVLILLPLSSFEAASVLPQAATQRARTLVAAERLAEFDPGTPPVAQALEDGKSSAVRDALRQAADQSQAEIASVGPREGDSRRPNLATHSASEADPRVAPAHLRTSRLTLGWETTKPLGTVPALEAPPGHRTLIYGASGRGKSTYAMTLAGLLSPVDGHVAINGVALNELSEAQQRATITYFAEDAHVFATSVRENIRVVRASLTDDDISSALSRAGLHDWVASLPRGLDTELGSHGTDVSGGERRRLLLARAIAAHAPITILDEPTEHLDMALADELMTQILTPGEFFDEDTTVIVITHDSRFKRRGLPVIDMDTMGTLAHRHQGANHAH